MTHWGSLTDYEFLDEYEAGVEVPLHEAMRRLRLALETIAEYDDALLFDEDR